MEAIELLVEDLPNRTGWLVEPDRPHMVDPFTPGALCFLVNDVLRYLFSSYAEEWYGDWKLWFGLAFTLGFKVASVFLHVRFKGMMQRHPTTDQLLRMGKKFGSNMTLLHLMQYYSTRAEVRHLTVPFVMLPSIIEKFFYFWHARHSSKFAISKIYVHSIYMRFELHSLTAEGSYAILMKLICIFCLQLCLIIFYWARVVETCGGLAYLFWFVSLLVQTVGEMTHMFGDPWDYSTWRFLVHNAGRMKLRRVDTTKEAAVEDDDERELTDEECGFVLTPSVCGTYLRFLASVVCGMLGRQTIIDTLPLFLMASTTPIDFCLNCVATGFFMSLSQSTACTYNVEDLYGYPLSDSELSRLSGGEGEEDYEDPATAALTRNVVPARTVALPVRRQTAVPGRVSAMMR